jgi:hypothetical protein
MERQLEQNNIRIGIAQDFYETLLIIQEDLIWKKQMLEAESNARKNTKKTTLRHQKDRTNNGCN